MKENIPADLKDMNSGKHQPMEYDPNTITQYSSGAKSRKVAPMHLLPVHGLENAAYRYELGLKNYGSGAFNALSNQKQLDDKTWLIDRCSHAILHLYNIIKLISEGNLNISAEDAGAIAWCGITLGEAVWRANECNKSKAL